MICVCYDYPCFMDYEIVIVGNPVKCRNSRALMISNKVTFPPLKIEEIINFSDYPITNLSEKKSIDLINNCRQQLQEKGCCILSNFLTTQGLFNAQEESKSLAPAAYYAKRHTNAFKTDDDPSLPLDHPVRFFMERTNAFVPQNKFTPDSLFLNLYHAKIFQEFIAACLDTKVIYEYDDPLAGMVLNILPSGCQHPWHYDENDFSIVLMIQPALDGGIFEYAHNIRTPNDENFPLVSKVLRETYQGTKKVNLQPGDLQIFYGKSSLHRVTKTIGDRQRHTAIFSYTRKNHVIGKITDTKLLFGHTTVDHEER